MKLQIWTATARGEGLIKVSEFRRRLAIADEYGLTLGHGDRPMVDVYAAEIPETWAALLERAK